MLKEELVVSNKKIRIRQSNKLLVKSQRSFAEVFVNVQGEVDPEIKEVLFNGVKSKVENNKFSIEYLVREKIHESRVYGHDDPKSPNYAVVRFSISKLQEIKEYSKKFFEKLDQKLDAGLSNKKLLLERFIEFRRVPKSDYYEPFLVLRFKQSDLKKLNGNFVDSRKPDLPDVVDVIWVLDEALVNLHINGILKVDGVDCRHLYPGGVLPWELTTLEKELGPSRPSAIDPSGKNSDAEKQSPK
jgi:hypothetical protein